MAKIDSSPRTAGFNQDAERHLEDSNILKKSLQSTDVDSMTVSVLGHLVEAEELIMVHQGGTMRSTQMVPVDRPSGQNDVGIVAWLLTLKTPECTQGRQASSCLSLPFTAYFIDTSLMALLS